MKRNKAPKLERDIAKVSMSDVLPGRPSLVRRMLEVHSIETLAHAHTVGFPDLLRIKGMGKHTIDEIEIALLIRGKTLFDPRQAKITWMVIRRFGMTNDHYKIGHPTPYRGTIRVNQAQAVSWVMKQLGISYQVLRKLSKY